MPTSPAFQPLDGSEPVSELVARFQPLVDATVRGFRLDGHTTEDVVQDTWLQFLRHRHRIRHTGGLPNWLRTTAARQAMRAANARRESPSPDIDEATTPQADDVFRRSRDRTLWHEVDRLPARDQHLVRLIAHEPQLTHPEIAMRLGVAPNSVGQLRTRCLRRLRRKLATAGITDAGV